MSKYYSYTIRIASIIILIAFIFTQAGLGTAMPTRYAENLRKTQEGAKAIGGIGHALANAGTPDAGAGEAAAVGMNGRIRVELERLAEEISGVGVLNSSFKNSIVLMKEKDDERSADVPWHGFSHSGGNTAIALRGMRRMAGAPAEAKYLVGIGGMLHDIGDYLPDYAHDVIKLGHEQRGREFVLNEAEKHEIFLNNEQKQIVNLIISMTEMKTGADVWVDLFKAIRDKKAEEAGKVISENGLGLEEKLYTDEHWRNVLEYALLGGIILAYLDIHDPRPDAALLKTALHEEFKHDIDILRDVKEGLTDAETKELNMLIGMHKNTLAEQLQDTHNFLTGFGESRLGAFRPYIFDYIPKDAKRNMAITEKVASKVRSEFTDSEIESLLQEETRAAAIARADGELRENFGTETREWPHSRQALLLALFKIRKSATDMEYMNLEPERIALSLLIPYARGVTSFLLKKINKVDPVFAERVADYMARELERIKPFVQQIVKNRRAFAIVVGREELAEQLQSCDFVYVINKKTDSEIPAAMEELKAAPYNFNEENDFVLIIGSDKINSNIADIKPILLNSDADTYKSIRDYLEDV